MAILPVTSSSLAGRIGKMEVGGLALASIFFHLRDISMAYETKSQPSYISSTIGSINPFTVARLQSIGKGDFDSDFLSSQGVKEAILTTKSEKSTIPVLCIQMSTGSYHCINYSTYPIEPRFFNASLSATTPCRLGLIGQVPDNTNTIFLFEGIWDWLMMKKVGMPALALPGVNNLPKTELSKFENKTVYIVFDNDDPGKKYALKHARTLSTIAKEVYVVTIPKAIEGVKVKDISDVYKTVKTNFEDYFSDLVEKAERTVYSPIATIASMMLFPGSLQANADAIIEYLLTELKDVRMGEIIPYDKYHDIAIIDGGRRILCDEKVDQYLSRIYDYADSDQLWRLIRDKLYNHATRKKNVLIDIYSTYRDGRIYLGIKDNGVLVIDGHGQTIESQGIDSIYIRSGSGVSSQLEHSISNNGSYKYDTFEKLLDIFNFVSEENKFLLKAWFYFTFFTPRMKPILAIYADKGCGKTLLQKIMKGVLFGFENCDPNVLPDEDISFIMMVKENKYLFFDEVDRYNNSMKPYLRTLSTGVEIVYRPKYAKENVRFTPNSWLSLSSNSPKFRDDDVAQRLCIINLLPFTGAAIREDIFLKNLGFCREKIYQNIVKKLKNIIGNFQNEEEIKLDNYCRLVEFANFAYQAFPEEREICLRAFNSLNKEQQKFSSELDPMMDLFENWISVHHSMIQSGTTFLAKEIHTQMLQDSHHKEIRTFPASVASFGRWIGSRLDELYEKFGMEKKVSHGSILKYSFDKEKCKSYQEEF